MGCQDLLQSIFPGSSDGKESACNAGNAGSIPGSGRSPGEGHDYPLQYACLENPMDRGVWQATSMGLQESNTTKRLTLYRPTHKTSSAHLHKWSTLPPPNQLPRLPCEAAAVVHSDTNEIKTKTKTCTEGFLRMLCLLTITHQFFGFFFPPSFIEILHIR